MEWYKCKKEDYVPIQCMDRKGNIYHIKSSPIDIEPDEENNNIKYIFSKTKTKPLYNDIKIIIINNIKEYDKSEFVNCFNYKNKKAWFDKDTRLGLKNKFTTLLDNGINIGSIWFDEDCYEVNCIGMLEFLDQLELYAIKTNDATRQHLKNVNEINDIETMIRYNITADYPEIITMSNDIFVNNSNINNN